MAQNTTTEYLQFSCSMKIVFSNFCLEMVSEDTVDGCNGCVVDGNGMNEMVSEDTVDGCNGCVVDGNGMNELFQKDDESQVIIKSLDQTTVCPKNIKPTRGRACLINKKTEEINLYYYKSNMPEERRKAVVLNISNSQQFLKCTFNHDKAVLSIECWDKEKLKSISKDDQLTWPFVFYLTSFKDKCRRFESAQCRGWFICTKSEIVLMDKKDNDTDLECSFLITSSPDTSKSK